MEPLYRGGFTPETVLALGYDKLLDKIRTVGLAPTKAKNILALTKLIIEEHGGKVPRSREDLEALPGVGRKTANVVLGEIWGEPTLAVDTHVFRVGRRLGLHGENTPEKAEQAMLKVIDSKYLPAVHHWIILHGRYVCKAKSPDCAHCPIADICPTRN
jgi:endonuclease-3